MANKRAKLLGLIGDFDSIIDRIEENISSYLWLNDPKVASLLFPKLQSLYDSLKTALDTFDQEEGFDDPKHVNSRGNNALNT